jgi:t-SNARE complex subunit (syntaxin)
MNGDRSARALARIEAALARIEIAAPQAGANQAAADEATGAQLASAAQAAERATTELQRIQARHEQLRAAVTDSLAQLDQLIAGAQVEGAGQ